MSNLRFLSDCEVCKDIRGWGGKIMKNLNVRPESCATVSRFRELFLTQETGLGIRMILGIKDTE